jgi:hypothetical protein
MNPSEEPSNLIKIYKKEEELLIDILNVESTVSWQRFSSSLVANSLIIAVAGVLLTSSNFWLKITTLLLAMSGICLNMQFRKILIRAQAKMLASWEIVREVERRIKQPDESEPPLLVWETTKYDELVQSYVDRKRKSGRITTVMIGLPVIFTFAFVLLAVAAVLSVAFGRFCVC